MTTCPEFGRERTIGPRRKYFCKIVHHQFSKVENARARLLCQRRLAGLCGLVATPRPTDGIEIALAWQDIVDTLSTSIGFTSEIKRDCCSSKADNSDAVSACRSFVGWMGEPITPVEQPPQNDPLFDDAHSQPDEPSARTGGGSFPGAPPDLTQRIIVFPRILPHDRF